MVDLAEADPGRAWRRLARAGAALTALAMVVHASSEGKSLLQLIVDGWVQFAHVRRIILNEVENLADFSAVISSMGGMICTLPFVAAIVMCVLCGRNGGWSGAEHVFRMTLLAAGVLVTAGTVYTFFLFFYFRVMVLLWIPHVYLFLAAMALLDGWHRRESSLCVFWPGTFLVMSACVAWGFFIYGILSFVAAFLAGFQGGAPT